MIRHVENFRHADDVYPLVTVVPTREAAAFLGVERGELRRRLRELRDAGELVADRGRLTKRVRVADPTCKYGVRHVRSYVLRGERRDFEKPRGRANVLYW